MSAQLPKMEWPVGRSLTEAIGDEWLLSNGIGGYAGTSVAFSSSRKYHGLLIAALPGLGRIDVLPMLEETLRLPSGEVQLGAVDRAGSETEARGFSALKRFQLDGLIPEWEYDFEGTRISRSVVLVYGENTVCIRYRLLAGEKTTLSLRPFIAGRNADGPLCKEVVQFWVDEKDGHLTVGAPEGIHPVTIGGDGVFTRDPKTSPVLRYRIEEKRGYDSTEMLSSPGTYELTLEPGKDVYFSVSLDHRRGDFAALFEAERAREFALIKQSGAREGSFTARLTLAADQFIIVPGYRAIATATALKEHRRSIVAGYPWFTDWGRDTMISLEGLTIHTGRVEEAVQTLKLFKSALRDGLVPNYFPEGTNDGVYHTADATLWFFHALSKVLAHSKDEGLLKEFWPALKEIVAKHVAGTKFNIGVDANDGLLKQGAEGYQLTWMDAKVDGWVVTPRRGKAVELQALWFNALCLMRDWARELGEDASEYAARADQTKISFNERFWNAERGCCFDLVDTDRGNDAAVRPNQIFTISLTHPILDREKWLPVLGVVSRELLTPVGLRTLSTDHADYHAKYDGDLRSRDAAYHQGTVWPWLLGHYVDAELKAGTTPADARRIVQGLTTHLLDGCLGSVSEIFDASAPFHQRGCYAQAWSVAELLRTWSTLETLHTDAHSE